MEMIVVGIAVFAVLFIILVMVLNIRKAGSVKGGVINSMSTMFGGVDKDEPVQPVKVRSGWQVRFSGEWHECSPPLGENSPGWVRVRLTDRRTHSRAITRRPDEIRKAQ